MGKGRMMVTNDEFLNQLCSNGFCYLFKMQVRPQIGQNTSELSPFIAELEQLEEQAKQKGLGIWNKASLSLFGVFNCCYSFSFLFEKWMIVSNVSSPK